MPYHKPLVSPIVRFFKYRYWRIAYSGAGVICPICSQEFRAYVGSPVGHCPGCRAPARSRLLWYFLENERPELLSGSAAVLQIAPDAGLEGRLRQKSSIRYLSGDLYEPEAMVQLDLTRLDLPDQSFDVVICV